MAIPNSSLTVRDGGLGLAAPDSTRVAAKIGCSSAGTSNVPLIATSPQVVRDTFGTGPLVEAALYHLAVAGGPIVLVKSPSSTAGSAGTVTATQTGTATLAITGGALDAYDFIAVVVTGGATLVAAAATFRYSLDGGRTYSAEIAIPASGIYAISGTGLTLTWTYASGVAFVAADRWVSTVTGPASTLAETMVAVDALLADSQQVFNLHLLGIPALIADAVTAAAALDVKVQAAETGLYRYLYGTLDCPSDTDANIKTAFLAFASTRVEICAGFASVTSVISGSAYKRPVGWVSTARAASVVPSESVGRFARGAVRGVVAITRDENATPGLDAARFTTLRTFVGATGFFLTNGRIMAGPTSDFTTIERRRVMDVASAAVRAAQLRYINETLRVDATTGKLLAEEANDADAFVGSALRAAVVSEGWASGSEVAVDRNANLLSTETLDFAYAIIPLGMARQVRGSIGFKNPAITAI